jgi:hypothetical protein
MTMEALQQDCVRGAQECGIHTALRKRWKSNAFYRKLKAPARKCVDLEGGDAGKRSLEESCKTQDFRSENQR